MQKMAKGLQVYFWMLRLYTSATVQIRINKNKERNTSLENLQKDLGKMASQKETMMFD